MANIIEKDMNELTKKKKPFKIVIRRTIIGLLIITLALSFIPNAEYYVTLNSPKNATYIESVMDKNISKEKQIAEIFAYGINNNTEIPTEDKEKIINSFTKYVIEDFGEYFTEETISNMLAIALTEKIEKISKFEKNHSWYTGDYVSYLNKYSLNDSVAEADETLIAHEQLHAILKSGLFGTGLTSGIEGYALNEGLTSFIVKKDSSYSEEQIVANTIGLIIGYEEVISYYLNGDLKGLKQELEKYLDKKEVNKLTKNLDLNIFSNYLTTFLNNNNINYNEEKLYRKTHTRTLEIQEIMKKIFEKKYKCQIGESKLGRIIFGNGSNYFDNNWQIDEPFYVIEYYNREAVKLTVLLYNNFEWFTETYIIDLNELENIDIDKLLEDIVINTRNKLK